MKGTLSLKQIITTASALAAFAAIAVAVYLALYGARTSYPALAAATAIKALRPIALLDYVHVYVAKVHYEAKGDGYALMPGPSPPGCASCIPPAGWIYSVSIGANASPIYGVYYTAENNTLLIGNAVVIPPYFANDTLFYVYPMCPGGFKFAEEAVSANAYPLRVVVILLRCS